MPQALVICVMCEHDALYFYCAAFRWPLFLKPQAL